MKIIQKKNEVLTTSKAKAAFQQLQILFCVSHARVLRVFPVNGWFVT